MLLIIFPIVATDSNKLKEHEIVTKGLGVKLKIDGTNFTEWNEAFGTHCKTMGMVDLFTCGPTDEETSHPAHDQFPIENLFFDSCGAISIEQVKLRAELIHVATGAITAIQIPK